MEYEQTAPKLHARNAGLLDDRENRNELELISSSTEGVILID